jgi:fructose-bisphosphate aldolase class I
MSRCETSPSGVFDISGGAIDMTNEQQRQQIASGKGFIAALDQSGGSTPKALALYGVGEDAYSSEDEMFGLIHAMRSRIIKSPEFTGDRVIGAILFERTMDGDIDGTPVAQYLWENRHVVPFLKVDKGLDDCHDDARMLKPMPDLDALLAKAVSKGIFGTKMRSVIDGANPTGIGNVVAQQFEVGKQILAAGLVPIIEPEVTITIADKAQAEDLLRDAIAAQLDQLAKGQEIILKLTLPENVNQYKPLVDHPRVMRVVALSGGYSRTEANNRLSKNSGMIASFSRALTEGLSAGQADADFDLTLGQTIADIREASIAG